jgi:hypothetical protein
MGLNLSNVRCDVVQTICRNNHFANLWSMFVRMAFAMFTPLLEKVLVGKSFCSQCVKWPLVKSYNQMIGFSFKFSFFPNKSHLAEEFEMVAIRCNRKFEKIKSLQTW